MVLNDEQKQQVATWVRDGLGLAEVQRRLESEFGLRSTFMEVRFLVDDLDLSLIDPAPPKQPEPAATAQQHPAAGAAGAPVPQPGDAELEEDPYADEDPFGGEIPGGGSATVSIDPVQRPGALVSGTVIFSDGESMGWQLDQMGRLGLIPGKTEGYRPSEPDIAAFQVELQKVLQRQGF